MLSRITILALVFAVCAGVASARPGGDPLQVGDDDSILLSSWSPDSTRLLVATGDGVYIRLWDVASGAVLWKANVARFEDDVESVYMREAGWTPDGKFVVTGSSNGKLQLWNAETGALVWNVRAHDADVSAIGLSPDGSVVVSSAEPEQGRSRIVARRMSDGGLVRELGSASSDVISLRFVDATHVEAGDLEGNVSLWATDATGPRSKRRAIRSGSALGFSNVVAYSPDFGRVAVRKGSELLVVDSATGRVVARLPFDSGDPKASFSADGTILAKARELAVLDADGRRVGAFPELEAGVLSPDGESVAATDYAHRGVQIVSAPGGARRAWLVGHPGTITALAFDASGARFASASSDEVIRVWDAATRRVLLELEGHAGTVKSLAFGLDGKSLASASEDESIEWDLTTGLPSHRETIRRSFASGDDRTVSPSGKLALVEEYRKPFRLADAATGSTIREFEYVDQLDTLTFCPDERRFLEKPWWSGFLLRSVDGGGPIGEFDVGYSYHNVVAFAPDGRTFVVGGSNQNLVMFDLDTGATLWSLFPIDRDELETQEAGEARRVAYVRREEEATKRADDENARNRSGVTVSFDHYGDMTDPGDLRLVESSAPTKSRIRKSDADANAVWLRLRNDSPLPVEVSTQSVYLGKKPCVFTFPDGASVSGLCDGAEIAVRMGLEDKNGVALPYGFDFGSSAVILPAASALFAVPRGVLANGNRITFNVTFQRPDAKGEVRDSGSPFALTFGEADIHAAAPPPVGPSRR